MSDPDLHPHPLGLALHERVRHERPDLDLLVERASTSGRHLRRRRRVGATLATALGVVTVAALGTQLSGGVSSSDAPAYVASPSAGSSSATSPASSPASSPDTSPDTSPDDRVTTVRLSELMRMVSVLRDELRREPAGSPRAEELRELLDGVRLADEREQTRAERVAALERLIAAVQRVEGERSAD